MMLNKTIITTAMAVMITISGLGINIVGTFSVTPEPQAIFEAEVENSPGDPDPLYPIYSYSPEFLEVYTIPRYPIGYAWNDPSMTGDIITLYANVIDVDGNGVWLDYGYCDRMACYMGEDFIIMGFPPWPMDLVSGTLYRYQLRGHWVAGSPSYEASSSHASHINFRISAMNTSGGPIGYPENPVYQEEFYPAWPPTSINATSSTSRSGLSPGETYWVNGTGNYWNSTLDPEDPSTSMPTDESDVTIRIEPGGTEFFGKTNILGNYSVLAAAPATPGAYVVNTSVTNSTPLRNVTCVANELSIEVFTGFDIPISVSIPGWAFISFPIVISGDATTVLNDSINGDGQTTWDVVQWYDALAREWRSYSIFKPPVLNNMPDIDNTMGVWVHITSNGGDENITTGLGGQCAGTGVSIPLYAGWNLVGYPTMSTEIVANALWGTGADRVEVFDPGEPYRIREVGPSYLMKPGEGYWVHVPADTTWTIDW